MITNTAIASFEGPRKSYFFPMCEEEMISDKQKAILTSLIFQYVQEEEEREHRLSELEDLTSKDADNEILRFSMARW